MPDEEDQDSSNMNLRQLSALLTNNSAPVSLGFAGDIMQEEVVKTGQDVQEVNNVLYLNPTQSGIPIPHCISILNCNY